MSARSLVVALALPFAGVGCRSSTGGAAETAAANTVFAAGMAGARRAGGDCYSPCAPGHRCNRETGLCDPIACQGRCQQWERCDENGLLPRCVSAAPFEVARKAPASAVGGTPAQGVEAEKPAR